MTSVQQIKEKLSDAVVYWNKPLKGRQMPFKEVASYSVGGIGVYFIKMIAMTVLISATNVVLSNATGIPPRHLLVIYYITVIAGIPLTAVKAHMIDGLRMKTGKYRPWILGMGVPTVILCLLLVYTPYSIMPKTMVYIITTVYSVALNFTYYFFEEAYENLLFLLSSNTQERADVSSIKSITYSFAPTVYSPLIPLMVGILGVNDIYDIKIYQVLFPIIAVIGVALSVLTFANTKEKLVQAKTHVVEIGFFEAIKAVAKNKYFWIISLAGWIGFLEGAMSYVLTWLYNYAHLCTDGQYAIITLIYGNASLWGMIAAPFCIRRWGKKWTLIVTNLFNIVFISGLYPAVALHVSYPQYCIWAVLFFLYLNALMGSFALILTPSINADIRDYQHYITGERIDGMFAAVGLITSFITMATNTVIPLVFDKYGINDNNGFDNAFDILKYEPDTLYSLIHLLIGMSIIGAALNVIPYFFYDLSEKKQRAMVAILKVRAVFEDFGNGMLLDKDLVEGVDIMHQSAEDSVREPVPVDKTLGKKAMRKTRKENDDIDIGRMVLDEYHKFEGEEFTFKYNKAQAVVSGGIEGIINFDVNDLETARNMPKNTEIEKAKRRYCVEQAKLMLVGRNNIIKKYNGEMPTFDESKFEDLFAQEEANEEAQRLTYEEIDAAKTGDEKIAAKAKIKTLKEQSHAIEKAIKITTKENNVYSHTVKAYSQAEKLVKQRDNYLRFAEIEAMYDDATQRIEVEEQREAELAKAEALQKKLDREEGKKKKHGKK